MSDLNPGDAVPHRTPPSNMPPDHVGALVASFIMMAGGWYGLYTLVTTTLPRVGGPLWLFFLLLNIAVTGTVLPLIRYLNIRFTPLHAEPPPAGVLVRQSVWVGVFVAICAWLRMPRVLTWPIAFFLALVFIIIEVFLRSRELSDESA